MACERDWVGPGRPVAPAIWEVLVVGELLGSVLIGLVVALGALRWRPARFPHVSLALATGPVAALAGGLIARTVLGSGHLPVSLLCAALVASALVSLLMNVRPPAEAATDRQLAAVGRHH